MNTSQDDQSLVSRIAQAAAKTPARFSYDRTMPKLLATVRLRPGPIDVLDAGCGDGRYAAWFLPDRYIGIDLGDNLPKSSPERIFIKASVLDIPFEDASFDIVLCSLMIEHIPNVLAAITEMHRVMRPGGVLVLSTATRWAQAIGEMPNLFWKLDPQEHGQAYHYFETDDLVKYCTSAGFQTTKDLYIGGPCGLGIEYVRTFLLCGVNKLRGMRYEQKRDSTEREAVAPSPRTEGLGHLLLRKAWATCTVMPFFCGNWIAYALDRLLRSKMAKVVVIVARKAS